MIKLVYQQGQTFDLKYYQQYPVLLIYSQRILPKHPMQSITSQKSNHRTVIMAYRFKMKKLIELQRKTQDLSDDIQDNLHAASINLQVITVQTQTYPHSPLASKLHSIHNLIQKVQQLLQQRPQLSMAYLITRQIQEQEQSVRRERLTDYEEKIYDQRRIICDKQGFFESLLRPKKKRLPQQTIEDFQLMRAKERQAEEQLKTNLLFAELAEIQALKRQIQTQQRHGAQTRTSLLQTTKETLSNGTNTGDPSEAITEKTIQLQTNANKEKKLFRNCSLQQSAFHVPSPRRDIEPSQQQVKSLTALLGQINKFKQQNTQLSKIYEQECLALKFKKTQCHKILAQYQQASRQVTVKRQKLRAIKSEQQWKYQRCFQPVSNTRKTTSAEKAGRL